MAKDKQDTTSQSTMGETAPDKPKEKDRPWYDGGPGTPALPGEPCRTPPHPSWNDAEKWVWERACRGEIADLNKYCGKKLDPPKKDDGGEEKDWKEEDKKERKIRPEFIEMVLLDERWRGSLTRIGLRIIGAFVPGELSLANAELKHEFWLDSSLINGGMICPDLKCAWSISLDGSNLLGRLAMDRASIDGSLFMQRGRYREVRLLRMQVRDNVEMGGSEVAASVTMDQIALGGNLFLHEGRFQEVRLLGARSRAAWRWEVLSSQPYWLWTGLTSAKAYFYKVAGSKKYAC